MAGLTSNAAFGGPRMNRGKLKLIWGMAMRASLLRRKPKEGAFFLEGAGGVDSSTGEAPFRGHFIRWGFAQEAFTCHSCRTAIENFRWGDLTKDTTPERAPTGGHSGGSECLLWLTLSCRSGDPLCLLRCLILLQSIQDDPPHPASVPRL